MFFAVPELLKKGSDVPLTNEIVSEVPSDL
jgi:hypothetical protein